jgi:lipopolysaccharide transport system ATP-binding protein
VTQYLQSTSYATGANISWPDDESAPGDELVRLLGVRVIDEAGNTVDTVDVREPVGIAMRYRVLAEGPGLFSKIRVLDGKGAIAFNALDTRSHADTSSAPGMYESTAWIPANLLPEGTTKIDAAVCSMRAPKLHQRAARYDAVSFTVFDPGDGDSAKGRFTGELSGVVRPLLDWTVERID